MANRPAARLSLLQILLRTLINLSFLRESRVNVQRERIDLRTELRNDERYACFIKPLME
jgi:hypothetical protein